MTLADRLEADLGRKVDLVARRALKPGLRSHIEKEAIDVEGKLPLSDLKRFHTEGTEHTEEQAGKDFSVASVPSV